MSTQSLRQEIQQANQSDADRGALRSSRVAAGDVPESLRPIRVKAEGSGPLDVVASRSEDGMTFYIGVVNMSTEPVKASIKAEGLGKVRSVKRLVMTGPDENSYNEPGKPPAVCIREDELAEWTGSPTFDKLSLTIFILSQKRGVGFLKRRQTNA